MRCPRSSVPALSNPPLKLRGLKGCPRRFAIIVTIDFSRTLLDEPAVAGSAAGPGRNQTSVIALFPGREFDPSVILYDHSKRGLRCFEQIGRASCRERV